MYNYSQKRACSTYSEQRSDHASRSCLQEVKNNTKNIKSCALKSVLGHLNYRKRSFNEMFQMEQKILVFLDEWSPTRGGRIWRINCNLQEPSSAWQEAGLTVKYCQCEFLQQAIEGTYIDKKCPFTGNVSIRGRILTGIVTSMKMKRTVVIRRDYLHLVKKYNRYEKRHKNLSAHLSPCFRQTSCLCANTESRIIPKNYS